MIRLHLVVEGQTEEEFVNSVLAEHLGAFNISADVHPVTTSHHRGKIYRGGGIKYEKVKGDLLRWIKQDRNDDARFTTMFDLYALSNDFPKFDNAKANSNPYLRVNILEEAFAKDINSLRFIPYIQLYEFESILLSDPTQITSHFIEDEKQVSSLVELCSKVKSPELINDGFETAPSKQIIKQIPAYAGAKVSAGPLIAKKIGLTKIRDKCPHFNEWLNKLEKLDSD